ncbi:hypothetical protein M9H77_29570 [Catharanthus roseus]|uniref:Uncharacterized protein n=1 Tax=Catharanthus roseus TaxID=4058 RepID=A0ACB9ZWZ9_CATRO|nr:hypothetical protein M9H77_29570 [Catharanthus roseus]
MGNLKDITLIITMVAIAIGEILMKVKYIREHRLRNGSRPIISWESLKRDLRDKFGILDYQVVETPVGEFYDPLCKKSDYVYMEEEYEVGSNVSRCHEILKEEQIKKASRVEESLRGTKLPQTKIEIEGSVEVHIEEEMSKEGFCDSMSDMSFEEKERLVEKSSFFISISSLGEKCKKDKCSKEKENDLEKNERTKEMSEEKRENSKEELNVFERCWHDIIDVAFRVVDSFPSWASMWGMIPDFLDSFVGKFIVKKVEGYFYSLIEDLLDKSIRRIVETYFHMISSFETFLITLKRIGPFENHFLNMKVQLENPCDDPKFLIGWEVLKAFLIENILGFQFYHLHFKESMFLLIFENKKKDSFGALKVCHRVFVGTILRKDFLELLLKNLVEKHLCYFKTFIEILWKDIFLDGLLVPNKNSFVISMKHEFSGTLLYHLPFKELLKKFDKHENMESFQGSVTGFQGPITRSRVRKIEEETQKTSLEEFEAIKAKGKRPKTYCRCHFGQVRHEMKQRELNLRFLGSFFHFHCKVEASCITYITVISAKRGCLVDTRRGQEMRNQNQPQKNKEIEGGSTQTTCDENGNVSREETGDDSEYKEDFEERSREEINSEKEEENSEGINANNKGYVEEYIYAGKKFMDVAVKKFVTIGKFVNHLHISVSL